MMWLKESLTFSLAMLAAFAVVAHCTEGCKPAEQAGISLENAAAVAQYKALLADCKARGKDAGSYAVYDECADALDRQLCRENSLRCEDGGAP